MLETDRAPTRSEALPHAELRELHLASAELDDSSVAALARGLAAAASSRADGGTLRTLVLRDNECGDGGARHLAGVLQRTSTLTTLVLHDNMIGDSGAAALAAASRAGVALARLDLGVNELSVGGVRALAEALASEQCALAELHLDANEFGAAGARHLAAALRRNARLRLLALRANGLGDKGAVALGEALGENGALQHLDLRANGIGPTGAYAIADGLRSNTALRHLDLCDNEVSDAGVAAIATAIDENRERVAVRKLLVASCGFGDACCTALARCLARNTTLRELDLEDNEIGAEGICALAGALCTNTTLRRLNFEGNELDDDDEDGEFEGETSDDGDGEKSPFTARAAGSALVALLERNFTLTALHIDFVGLPPSDVQLINEGLRRNIAIQRDIIAPIIANFVVALAPLHLSAYVLLDIIDRLPYLRFVDRSWKMERIELARKSVTNVYAARRRAKEPAAPAAPAAPSTPAAPAVPHHKP